MALGETASSGRSGADAHRVLPFLVQLVRAAKDGGASARHIGYIPAIAAIAFQIFRDLQSFVRIVQAGYRPDLPTHPGQNAHDVSAGTPNLFQDHLVLKRTHRRPLGIVAFDDDIQIEYACSDD